MARTRHRRLRRVFLCAEYVFLSIAIVALAAYMYVLLDSTLYQAYAEWRFEQQLDGRSGTVFGFLVDRLGIRRAEDETPAMTKDEEAQPPPGLPAQPEKGAVLGRLEIPRLRVSVMVREGVDDATLRKALGHVPGTAIPGRTGNVAVSGHRDTFFRPLRFIRKDDVIRFVTEQGRFEYLVESTRVVTPKNVEVLNATAQPTMTLITCYPFYYLGHAPKRFIVRARQVRSTQPPVNDTAGS
jgi:LPXTG-site transpeptidase (sortase) family protein